jgi:hypothetical protein
VINDENVRTDDVSKRNLLLMLRMIINECESENNDGKDDKDDNNRNKDNKGILTFVEQ